MKNALEWIKTNPISVGSGVVAFLGLLVFVYFYFISASSFRTEKAQVLATPAQSQSQLIQQQVPIPNEDPNAAPDLYTVVINQRVIDDVRTIYSEIKTQYDAILKDTGTKNSARHLIDKNRNQSVMLARGAIWPDKLVFSSGEQAKKDYLEQYAALFTFGKDEGWNMPSMVASSPPKPIEIEKLLARTAFEYINSIGVASAGELSQEQAERLYSVQRTALMNLLSTRARQIHLYVDLPRDQDKFAPDLEALAKESTPSGFEGEGLSGLGTPLGGVEGEQAPDKGYPAGYPFRLDQWVFASGEPTADAIWESQVELWIVRDIMTAIFNTNKVGQQIDAINDQGEPVKEWASAINSPIKRLLLLDPQQYYVGLHTTGAVLAPNALGTDNANNQSEFAGGFPGAGSLGGLSEFGGTPADEQPDGRVSNFYPKPPADITLLDPTEPAPEHFGITPTGRVSNSVFDVRHTRLIIDITWTELPGFIEQLRKVNYMTVVKVNLTDIDEYKILREEGYVYGDSDVVRAELIIESLWFRNWTEKFMPKKVKEALLMIEPDDAGFGGIDPNTGLPSSGF